MLNEADGLAPWQLLTQFHKIGWIGANFESDLIDTTVISFTGYILLFQLYIGLGVDTFIIKHFDQMQRADII